MKYLATTAALLFVVNIALDVIGWTHAATIVTMLLIVTVLAMLVWAAVRAVRSRRRTGRINTMRPRKPANRTR